MSIFAQILGAIKYIVKKADMVLLGLSLVATIYGLVLIASATNYTNSYRDVIVQGAAAVIGLFAYFIFSALDVEHYSEKWKWFFLYLLKSVKHEVMHRCHLLTGRMHRNLSFLQLFP